jgi:protein TilB
MALNNVPKIEGLGKCEFLKKLDLTINFVDVDELEASMDHLAERIHLRDLYMMGNPAQVDWGGFKNYVIARLPQLDYVDGEEITRGSRILADQQFPKLALELRDLAAAKRAEKAAKAPVDMASLNVDDACAYTPEVRVKMYEEIAEQKAEKEERANHMKPKERDFEREQAKAVAKQRAREEAGKIQQCNQGKWEFHWDEESKPGHVVLDVHIQRHLDSTLIDLDVHPHYVSVIIKSKTLRLALPAEIRASDSKAARSKTTGHLLVTMPKVDPDAGSMFLAPKSEANDRAGRLNAGAPKAAAASRLLGAPKNTGPKPKDNRSAMPTASIGSIGAMMLDDAKRPKPAELAAVATTRKAAPPPPPPKAECCVDFTAPPAPDDDDDDDEPPPLV